MEKRAQTTIFIIVGILIVVAIALIYVFYPQIKTVISGQIAPATFLTTYVEPTLKTGIETLSTQGGYAAPEGYILYQGKEVKYLCYTAQYYMPCRVQQPMIKRKFEQELQGIMKNKVEEGVNQMKKEYEKQGYEVSASQNHKIEVEVVPKFIRLKIGAPMTIKKDESVQNFNDFDIEVPSNMYDLLMISTSIVDYESTYGDSAVDLYHAYYPNIRIEKTKLTDGSKIYVVSDVTTKENFVFASRGLSWPGGYGYD